MPAAAAYGTIEAAHARHAARLFDGHRLLARLCRAAAALDLARQVAATADADTAPAALALRDLAAQELNAARAAVPTL